MSYTNIENKLNSGDIILLDGGMGAELENLGASMDKDLWSGRCSIDEPDIVYKAHQNFINSGADIKEINTVRKHLSKIKGGNLLKMSFPAKVHSFILSDVIGDDLSLSLIHI